MKPYVLSCCSGADLSREHFDRREIRYLYFHFEVGGIEYQDDLGKSMPPEELYQRMIAGESTKTSQVSIGEYTEHFERFLKEGQDVLHVTLSSGYPVPLILPVLPRRIWRRSTRSARFMWWILWRRPVDTGFSWMLWQIRETEGWILTRCTSGREERKRHLHHWFFSTDLTFFIRGGRISKTAGFIGTMLNICPLMNVNHLGQLIPREKVRTKKKVIKRIVEKMIQHAENGVDYDGKCYICHSLCIEDAKAVATLVKERFPKLDGDVEIYPIGATIGSHTGPGTVALFFWGDERTD